MKLVLDLEEEIIVSSIELCALQKVSRYRTFKVYAMNAVRNAA